MYAIGLDIGTTTICVSVIKTDSGKVIESITKANNTFIQAPFPQRIQDTKKIWKLCEKTIQELLKKYQPIAGIGVTGQMHGIVYTDQNGEAVSPLYTWQDGRGELLFQNQKSYVRYLSEQCNYPLASGFGTVTHYYNQINGLIDKKAVCFCSIMDYIAMKLVKRKTPLVHLSNAASFGLFNIKNKSFDESSAKNAGVDGSYFPPVTDVCKQLGSTEEGIPVFTAIGDNQASFIGSVREMKNSILVNVGTGSQISVYSDVIKQSDLYETRPLLQNDGLMVGSSLCGGRAYALLESFFRQTFAAAGTERECYDLMNGLAKKYSELSNPLQVNVTFKGTRKNPALRGSILNIDTENLTPAHLVCGVLEGIVNELYDRYTEFNLSGFKPAVLVGSGNGIRKNQVLQQMFAKKFGMSLFIPAHTEEAAFGAALFAMVGAGVFKDMEEAQVLIRYEKPLI